MTTLRDELAEKTKDKIIELFGPESALAQAMEDENFLEKLAQLVAWIYGEIMLSMPRPQSTREKRERKSLPAWQINYRYQTDKTTGGGKWVASTTDVADSFTHKLLSAMDNYKSSMTK